MSYNNLISSKSQFEQNWDSCKPYEAQYIHSAKGQLLFSIMPYGIGFLVKENREQYSGVDLYSKVEVHRLAAIYKAAISGEEVMLESNYYQVSSFKKAHLLKHDKTIGVTIYVLESPCDNKILIIEFDDARANEYLLLTPYLG